jgi:hypothetical protein
MPNIKTILYICLAAAILILVFFNYKPGEGPLPYETDHTIDTIGNITISNKGRPLPVIEIAGKKDLLITGWAVDDRAKLPAGGVEVNIDGKLYPAVYGLDRPDVAKAYDIPAYRMSGFKASIPFADIGKGEHAMALKVYTNDKKKYFSSGEKIKFKYY